MKCLKENKKLPRVAEKDRTQDLLRDLGVDPNLDQVEVLILIQGTEVQIHLTIFIIEDLIKIKKKVRKTKIKVKIKRN